jgi:hypothetical protein
LQTETHSAVSVTFLNEEACQRDEKVSIGNGKYGGTFTIIYSQLPERSAGRFNYNEDK